MWRGLIAIPHAIFRGAQFFMQRSAGAWYGTIQFYVFLDGTGAFACN